MDDLLPYSSIFELVGGEKFFTKLVNIFYNKVEKDSILKPLFPQNLEPGKQRQNLFLQQFFGGPNNYELIRGQPMLRKRHLKFKIGLKERNRWLSLMMESLEELGINKDHKTWKTFETYFSTTATKMINQNTYQTKIPLDLKDNLL